MSLVWVQFKNIQMFRLPFYTELKKCKECKWFIFIDFFLWCWRFQFNGFKNKLLNS